MKSIKKPAERGMYISPEVNFDAETGICELKGESFLEETSKFYEPLLQWIKEFKKTGKPIILNIKLIYFNTSTAKWILNILHNLKDYEEEGFQVTINWYYMKGDVDMREEIEDYEMDSGLNINKIEVENESFFE